MPDNEQTQETSEFDYLLELDETDETQDVAEDFQYLLDIES